MARTTKSERLIAAEASMFGSEPSFEKTSADPDVQLLLALNWYNTMSSNKELKAYTIEYAEAQGRKEDADFLRSVEDRKFFIAGKYARVVTRGAKLNEQNSLYLENMIRELVILGKKLQFDQKQKDIAINSPSIQKRIADVSDQYIFKLNSEIDRMTEANFKTEFEPEAWIKQNNIKAVHLEAISKYFTVLKDELEQVKNNSDEQLVEGWSHLKKPQLIKLFDFVVSIVNSANLWKENIKSGRPRRRARKPVPIEKQIAKVSVLSEDKETGITSINLKKIIGATELWFYWPKYRFLGVYYSLDAGGFAIKGKNLLNFDPTRSVMKRLRKPKEVVPVLNTKGKRECTKTWESIRCKPRVLKRGKLRPEYVLFKVA